MDFDHEAIRTIDVVCRDEAGRPLMAYQLRVDPEVYRGAVTCEVLQPQEPIDYDSRRVYLPPSRSFKITAPLGEGSEVRVGAAIENTVLCRWDAEVEQYVPVMAAVSR